MSVAKSSSVTALQAAMARPAPLDPGPGTELAPVEPTAIVSADPLLADLAAPLPESLPQGEGDLSGYERDILRRCKARITLERAAFIEAGRALKLIRDGRLYRDERGRTFDQFVAEQFGYTRGHAYKLMEESPVGEAMSSVEDIVAETHVRALMTLVKRLDDRQAAVIVYQGVKAVCEAVGQEVTAKVLGGVAADVLAIGRPGLDQVAELTRTRLNAEQAPRPAADDPAQAFPAQVDKLIAFLNRTRDVGDTVPDATLEAVRRAARRLTAALKEGGL